jgi:hypothetical protein
VIKNPLNRAAALSTAVLAGDTLLMFACVLWIVSCFDGDPAAVSQATPVGSP